MKKQILFCKNCHLYTLKQKCYKCNSITITTKPAKFSLEDKYLKYRLIAKKKNDI